MIGQGDGQKVGRGSWAFSLYLLGWEQQGQGMGGGGTAHQPLPLCPLPEGDIIIEPRMWLLVPLALQGSKPNPTDTHLACSPIDQGENKGSD